MNLPIHLNALKAFEATARHKSFSLAADELCVTSAAVGQLVRSLEEWVGEALFVRSNSGKYRLTLTEVAKRALPDITNGFEHLALGVEKMSVSSSCGVLNIALSPSFAAKWLLPKLHRFQGQCPNIDVRLDVSSKLVNFSTENIDIGVRYGLGQWAELNSDKLMSEEIFPVCSPELLERRGPFSKPEEMIQEKLIHDASLGSYQDSITWKYWLSEVGLSEQITNNYLKINDSAAVLQLAIDGAGIALARSVMVHDDLAAGRLIRLFPEIKMNSPLSYYMVYNMNSNKLSRVQVFKEWLLKEADNNVEP